MTHFLRAWRWTLLVFILWSGLTLRLSAARLAGDAPPPVHTDAADYWNIAQSISSGNGFSLDGRPTASRQPLYPAVLAVLQSAGAGPKTVKIMQAVLGVLAALFVYLAASRLGFPGAGLFAAAAMSFHPAQIGYSASLGVEAAFCFLVALIAWAWCAFVDEPSAKRAVVVGLSLALGLLCRSMFTLLPPLLAWLAYRRAQAGHRRRAAAALLACSFILPALWALRGKAVLGHASLSEAGNAGMVFYEGTLREERSPLLTESEPAVTVMELYAPGRRSGVFFELAARRIFNDPLHWLKLTTKRMARLPLEASAATVDDARPSWEPPAAIVTLVHAVLLFGALAGILSCASLRRAAAFPAYFALLALLSYHARYSGHLFPALAVVGAAGWAAAWPRLKRTAPLAGLLASACALPPAPPSAQELSQAPALSQLAAELVRQGRPLAALPLFEKALASADESVSGELVFNRAACLVLLERYPEALDDLNAFLSSDAPAQLQAAAFRRRAALKATLGDLAGAREDIAAGLALRPDDRELRRARDILERT